MDIIELYAEQLKNIVPEKSETKDIELISNRTDDIHVPIPFFLTNAILATATEDKKTLLEKKYPKEPDDMIEKAHPVSVYVSNALGDGGLVENQNEAQKKVIEMINKRPVGQHINIYAGAISALIKIADQIEAEHPEIADMLDDVLADLAGADIKKKAFLQAYLVPILISAGAALIPVIFSAINGIQENIKIDAEDLLSNIRGWMNDSEYHNSATLIQKLYADTQVASALADKMLSASAKGQAESLDENELNELSQIDAKLAEKINDIVSATNTLRQTYPGATNLDFTFTTDKASNLAESYQKIHDIANQVVAKSQAAPKKILNQETAKPEQNSPENDHARQPAAPGHQPAAAPVSDETDKVRISDIQKFIVENYKSIPITGVLDYKTEQALVDIENKLNQGYIDTDGHFVSGLGIESFPGTRLAGLAKTTLTAAKLAAIFNIFKNPSLYSDQSLPELPKK